MATSSQTLESVLCTPHRDFLVDKDGNEVKVSTLKGKVIAIYFAASFIQPCQTYSPKLIALYEQLKAEKKPFEVVLASADNDLPEYKAHHKTQPWLAIPYTDRLYQRTLEDRFKVRGIPTLVLLDETGATISTSCGPQIVREGAKAYPWKPIGSKPISTPPPEPRVEVKEVKVEKSKFEHLLCTPERDYLVDSKGARHPVAGLKGKIVGLYFSASWCGPCRSFTPILKQIYATLKATGKPFEVVLVSGDKDESGWQSYFAGMPWLSIPYSDREHAAALNDKYEVPGIPHLVLFDEEGDELTRDGVMTMQRTGTKGYPWKPDPEVLKRKKEAEVLAVVEFNNTLKAIFAHLDVNHDSKVSRSEVIQRIRESRLVSDTQINKAADDIMRDVDTVKLVRGEGHFILTDWLAYFESVIKINGGIWPLTHLSQLVGYKAPTKRAPTTYDPIDPMYI